MDKKRVIVFFVNKNKALFSNMREHFKEFRKTFALFNETKHTSVFSQSHFIQIFENLCNHKYTKSF